MTTVASTEPSVVKRLREIRVVPVATVPAARAAELGRTLVESGLPCVEIAFRNEDALEALTEAASIDGLLVGAGTILTPAQAEGAAAAGADFAVSPCTNEAVVRRCSELGLPFFPGVATPSEIDHARELGHRTLKFFPAEALGGPRFLRAVSA
jgi:2-dehydro-3-deoxyphosphogluconate aldolase/(4S)-4-hydroxy-2-oxoglutarate aldolase